MLINKTEVLSTNSQETFIHARQVLADSEIKFSTLIFDSDGHKISDNGPISHNKKPNSDYNVYKVFVHKKDYEQTHNLLMRNT